MACDFKRFKCWFHHVVFLTMTVASNSPIYFCWDTTFCKVNTEQKLARITVFSPKVQQGRGKGPECSGLLLVKTYSKQGFRGGLELVRKDAAARDMEAQMPLASCAGWQIANEGWFILCSRNGAYGMVLDMFIKLWDTSLGLWWLSCPFCFPPSSAHA